MPAMLTDFKRQCAACVVMIRPAAFGVNTQTLASNAFQRPGGLMPAAAQAAAATEFDAAVVALSDAGVKVLVLPDTLAPTTPDALFPNNWFSTDTAGRLVWYPMEAINRRWERRPGAVLDLLQGNGYRVSAEWDLSAFEQSQRYLEGTGAMVFDHIHQVVYAVRSSRAHPEALQQFSALSGYRIVDFDAHDRNGKSIYHSNVMMSVGHRFAVVCSESISSSAERSHVLDELQASGRTVIDISYSELYGFAGNLLELRGANERSVIALSAKARQSLTSRNQDALASFGALVSADLNTIETLAGGSFRCMLAEIFLPNDVRA